MAKMVTIAVLVVLLILGALFFFVHRPQSQALDDARAEAAAGSAALETAKTEIGDLKARVADLESLRDEARRLSENLQATQEELRAKEAELEKLDQTRRQLSEKLGKEIKDGQVAIQRFKDKLRVDVVDKILFDSGEAEVKESGQEVLRRVGEVLQGVTGRIIEVQGHTDNVQIGGRLAERYATNWELSAARAVNVVRFLQDQTGVDPAKLSAVAFSEYRPKASNETDEGKQENRRIEILLSPDLGPEG